MRTSQAGIDLIKKFEGCRLQAYLCQAGVPTIGYGHTAGVKMGQTITQVQAESFLRDDLVKFEQKVMKYDAIYHWNQNQLDALVSFAFNIGNVDQLTANGTRSITEIAAKMVQYNKAGGKVLPGLTRRREMERDLLLKKADGAVKSTDSVQKENTAKTDAATSAKPFLVKVGILNLNIRRGPGTDYPRTGNHTGKGVFTITEVKAGAGSVKGWGRLKSGEGWISLDHAVRI